MHDIATVVTVLAVALAAVAVSPPLTAWCATLTADAAAQVPVRVSPAVRVTSGIPAAILGGTAAVLAPFPAWWLFGVGGAALAVVDCRTHRLPARFVYPLATAITAVLVVDAAVTGQWAALARSALAATVVGGCWFLVAFVSPGAVGLGDIRVAALTAWLLGYQGWTAVLVGQLSASLLGVVTAAALLLGGNRFGAGMRVPMGPALIGGAFLAALTS